MVCDVGTCITIVIQGRQAQCVAVILALQQSSRQASPKWIVPFSLEKVVKTKHLKSKIFKPYYRYVKDLTVPLQRLEQVLETTLTSNDLCTPSIQIGLVGAVTHCLQFARAQDAGTRVRKAQVRAAHFCCFCVRFSHCFHPIVSMDSSHII